MPVFTTLIIATLVLSLTMFGLVVGRLFAYNRKYHLPESKYTKLFGIFTKEHVLVLYAILVVLHLIISIWFVWKL